MSEAERTEEQGMHEAVDRVRALSCWRGEIDVLALTGGITNANFLVTDAGGRFFVRIGDDIPVHGVMRFNELAASHAAHAAGVSPAVLHHEPGALVLEWIEGRTLGAEDVRTPQMLERIVPLVRRTHEAIPAFLRGPVLAFWVFQVIRGYAGALRDANSRMLPQLPRLLESATELEDAVGPVRLVFGHNDLLPGNFIDDGERLWLVDWDYAGFNSALFDLGGLASNNDLSAVQEQWLLEAYYQTPLTAARRRSYLAMKCASLLRESTWSMVQEHHSTLDFDYVAYTADNLARFERAYAEFRES